MSPAINSVWFTAKCSSHEDVGSKQQHSRVMATWGLDIITVATTFSQKQLPARTQKCKHSPELEGLIFRRLEFHLNQRNLETKTAEGTNKHSQCPEHYSFSRWSHSFGSTKIRLGAKEQDLRTLSVVLQTGTGRGDALVHSSNRLGETPVGQGYLSFFTSCLLCAQTVLIVNGF